MSVEDEDGTIINNQNTHSPGLAGKRSAVIVCWFLGMGTLLPWNSMLTINDYYYKVFPKYHPSRVLTLVYQPFSIVAMAFLAYNESKINTRKRNIAGYMLFSINSLLCVVLDLVTSGKGGIGAYIFLCMLVAAFGVGDPLVQGGVVGELSFMQPEFVQSFLGGLSFSGVLTSGMRLATKAVFEESHNGLRKGALLFLAISSAFEFACVFLYVYYFPKLPIVKHFRAKAAAEGSKTVSADLAAAGIHKVDAVKGEDRFTTKQLFIKNLDYELDLFLVFALTLSILPGFLYENTGTHKLGEWYPLVLTAMCNIGDLAGTYIPLIRWTRLENRKGLMTATLARLLFIPAFYFTAKYADQGWMLMLCFVLGLTNGYVTVCVMTAAPKGYKGPEQNALGNLLVFSILVGVSAGVCLDWLWLIGNGSF